MDASTLDSLARTIGSHLTRRGMLGALLSATAFLDLAAPEAEARRKRRNKRKCKRNQKRCGKTCIRKDECCTGADCGAGGICVKGACACPTGQKPCAGRCVAEAACCRHTDCAPHQECTGGACVDSGLTVRCGTEVISRHHCCAGECPGSQTCVDGFCVCPTAGMQPCPDGSCVLGGQCCEHHQCAGVHQCLDGYCSCPNAGEITCDDACCVESTGEICQNEPAGGVCTGGGCQPSDWCNTPDWQVCADHGSHACVCVTTLDDAASPSLCVEYYSLYPDTADCASCTTSADCGAGFACIQGSNDPNTGYCSCTGKFCAQLCDPAHEPSARRRDSGLASTEARIAAAEARIAAFPRAKRRPGSQ
jgi:hypothetical protein